ncbi:hypothetical protein ACFQ61_02000 [Streptomyces sp. NPDC056500]|uniref:DNA polymerase III subunit beta family protein n=1 Tax=Streptomyces sp. NPDC056500 TaxID=3345840 RepID=UPI003693B4ED
MTSIAARDLRRMLRQVSPHRGTDDTLPVLTGVRIEVRADSLFACATDRYTFAVARTPAVTATAWGAFIPAAELDAVRVWLKGVNGATIRLSAKSTGGRTRLKLASPTSKMHIDTDDRTYRRFPDWRKIIGDQISDDRQQVAMTGFTTKLLAWQAGPGKPIVFTDPDGSFIGAQMPFRVEGQQPADVVAQWARHTTD